LKKKRGGAIRTPFFLYPFSLTLKPLINQTRPSITGEKAFFEKIVFFGNILCYTAHIRMDFIGVYHEQSEF